MFSLTFRATTKESAVSSKGRRESEKGGEVQKIQTVFSPLTWYCICVAHRPGSLLSRSQIRVLVNGQLYDALNLTYPRTEKPLNVGRIGMHCFLIVNRMTPGISSDFPERPETSFRGRMSGFVLFEEAMPDEALTALYQAGPQLFENLVWV